MSCDALPGSRPLPPRDAASVCRAREGAPVALVCRADAPALGGDGSTASGARAVLAGLRLCAVSVSLMLLAVPVWAQPRWTAPSIPYVANAANQDGIPEAEVISAIQRSGVTWAEAAPVPPLVYVGATPATRATRNGINEVIVVPGRSYVSATRAASGLFYYDGSGVIVEADWEFYDEAWRFLSGSAGPCANGTDVYLDDLAVHETGHALGLYHTTVDVTATMAPYMQGTSCSQEWRTLEASDRAAILALYPVVVPPPPSAPKPCRGKKCR